MERISNFIVGKRRIILLITLLISIISAILIPKVSVNYDVSKYLPEDSDTSIGIKAMENEFGLIGSVEVMVKNIDLNGASIVYNTLLTVEGVKAIEFDAHSSNYYKDNTALYLVTINSNDYSKEAKEIIKGIKNSLVDYDVSVGGGAVKASYISESLQEEIPYFAIIAIVLICGILLLISSSWIEPLLFLMTSGIAILINYGTNIVLGEVSFITFSIAALLQLALSMDYSIMLMDQYHHESKDTSKNVAMIKALRKSFKSISSSSLTTIFGLLAMIFISFGIGRDLGFVLSKGILINVLIVFFALPGLILLFDKLLEKTKKKAVIIPVRFLTNLGIKGRYIISIIMLILLVGSYIVQGNLKLDYAYNLVNEQSEEINAKFGKTNQIVLLYKNDTTEENIYNILEFLDDYNINGNKVLNNVIDYNNTVALRLSSKEASLMSNIDLNLVENIYTIYNTVTGNTSDKIELNSLINFILQYVSTNPQYSVHFSEEVRNNLINVSNQLSINESLLKSNLYNRMIIRTNLSVESKETYKFFEDLNTISNNNLSEHYVLGETKTAIDIKESFGSEVLLITILTVMSMILIIALTYKSLSIPFILVALIQGAIWISMCIPVILNKSLYFLAFIVVQCIQMGATIDYAILLSSNYIKNRKKHAKKEALHNALKASILTIFTSASILVTATFVIAIVSSQELISTICMVIGRGTIVSALVVLIVLPACLILFDKLINKTTYKSKFY